MRINSSRLYGSFKIIVGENKNAYFGFEKIPDRYANLHIPIFTKNIVKSNKIIFVYQ